MKITYRMDKQLNTVFTKVEGLVTVEDFLELNERIKADREMKKNMNSLIDLTNVEPLKGIDMEKASQYLKIVESFQETIGECKWAVIAREDKIFGLSHIFEMLSFSLSVKIKIFRTEEEAREWLGI